MKNIFKRLGFLAISACIAVSGVFAAACANHDNDPASVGYSVTVLYPDGTPVKASDSGPLARGQVSVTLQDKDGVDITDYESGILDEYGTAHTDYKVPGEYNIAVHYIPEGYAYNDVVTTTTDVAKYTVTLENNTLSYEIGVQLPDGTPYAGKGVKLMKNGGEVASLTTNAQGIAKSEVIGADNYEIIVDAPREYGYRPATTSRSNPSSTVKLFDVHDISFKTEDVLDDEVVLKEWTDERNSPATNSYPVDTTVNQYLYEADIADDGEYFYRICAPWTGRYTINFKVDDEPQYVYNEKNEIVDTYSNYETLFYKDNYGAPISDWTISGLTNKGNNTQLLDLTKGDEYIFSVRSRSGEPYKTSFLISFAVQPMELETSEVKEHTLTFDQIDYAILKFRPTESAKYKITSVNGGELQPELISMRDTTSPLPGDYYSDHFDQNVKGVQSGANGNFEYEEEVQTSYTGNTYIYRIALKNVTSYPASLTVKIENAGPATPEVVYKTEVVTPSATLTQQTAPEGEWHWLDLDGDLPTERDGSWYINTAGGEKQVYVAISKPLDGHSFLVEYSFATLEYMGETGLPEGDESEWVQQNSDLTVTVDATLTRYNYTSFIKAYAAKCTVANPEASDKEQEAARAGTYALNGELKTFLERFTEARWANLMDNPMAGKPANPWLLACGYYA